MKVAFPLLLLNETTFSFIVLANVKVSHHFSEVREMFFFHFLRAHSDRKRSLSLTTIIESLQIVVRTFI